MPPRRSPRRTQTATSLARVSLQTSRWVERSLAEHEPPLTAAQYLALEQLDRGAVGADELSRSAAISRSAVSQLVASLGESGLVERTESPADRRQQSLRLSGDGRRVLRSARRLLEKRLDPLVSELPPREADALGGSLGLIENLLSGTPPPRRPTTPPRPPRPHPPRPRR